MKKRIRAALSAGLLSKKGSSEYSLSLQKIRQLSSLKRTKLARLFVGANVTGMRQSEQVLVIAKMLNGKEITQIGGGCLEVVKKGFGFLRTLEYNYLPCPYDIYLSPAQIRRFNLRNGDMVDGIVRPPNEKGGERYYALVKVTEINGSDPEKSLLKPFFDDLTPLYPNESLTLEHDPKEISTRVLDLFVPIGKGQRALIVAPPRTGKTMLMQSIANAISMNHPEVMLLVLLIDERPEEVTDMVRNVNGEVISSTFDEPAEQHIHVAEMVIEKAKRQVELGKDVVLLLDSITRLARAYNAVLPPSGKILSGGVDSNALHRPKRFFGSARNIENGGSLTIIATALVDTGSRMDEVIFEEFKGTGNSELHLDRRLMEKRIFPTLDIKKSGTRKEELHMSADVFSRIQILRQHYLGSLNTIDAMTFIHDWMHKTKSNQVFLDSMNS